MSDRTYIKHWEGRAISAESERDSLTAALARSNTLLVRVEAERDALRAELAEARRIHDASHAEVMRLADELRKAGWKGAAPMHLNDSARGGNG